MEYHFNDLGMPTEQSDQFPAEYTPSFTVPSQEGEYKVRSSILVDGGNRFGVSAVQFDKHEELIWMGNQGGHVTSYYGPGMQKYTSFQIHESEEVRDIVTTEAGIYALTKTTLRHQIRRGIPKFTHRSRNMTDMQCLYQPGTSKLLMGGHQDKLIDLDLTKMVETVIPITDEGCAVLRSGGGSMVACGSASGTVALRDLRSPETAKHSFRAHTACLSDLDMQGDLLITCGFTNSANNVAVAEPYVIVWDVRRLRGTGESAWTIPTASPPLLLHYVPAFSGRAVALSSDGHVSLIHVNAGSGEKHSVFQVDTHSSLCSVMDVSGTSQALVFGDQSGHLHLFSPQHNSEPVFNQFSRSTEFADTAPNVPFAGFSDKFNFSSVTLPPLAGQRWFNELPDSFFKKGYRKPKPIDSEVLKTMKMQGPIGYAPNPRTSRRNQMPYIEDTLEDLSAAKMNESKFATQPIPKHYQKVQLRDIQSMDRFNKHNLAEEATNYNKSEFPSLEAILPNSYCNSMLQVLYNTPRVKATLLAHTCAKEFCLSCELGFLFRMLDSSGGAPCAATNFLRAFRTVPEAAALGLILPERGPDPRVDLVALIQSWNRFILHQMHYEILETRKKEKEMALLTSNSPPKPRIGNAAPSGNAQTAQASWSDKGIEVGGQLTLTLQELRAASFEVGLRMNKTKTLVMTNSSSRQRIEVDGQVNGRYHEDYQYTELEFLGPSTEFEDGEPREDGWPTTLSQEEVAEDAQQNNVAEELPGQQAGREESEISQLFAIARHQLNRCLKCNKEEERESVALACALQYPGGAFRDAPRGFSELVRLSLAPRRAGPAWCDRCARFTPTQQQGRIVRLPPILAINCGGVTAHEKAYWTKGLQKDTPESTKRGSSGKLCRYGFHCARPGCRFKHPDRPSPSQGSSKSPESHCVLPHQLLVRLQSDGDIVINDKGDPNDNREKHKKKQVTIQYEEEYLLSAAVVCVEDNPKHLVAYVQAREEWYMFNDISITPVNAAEVVQFSPWWKTPCVLFYSASSLQPEEGS